MSYCRWSLGCDIYCYESRDGFVISVASLRIVGAPLPDIRSPEFSKAYNERMDGLPKVRIGKRFDGRTYTEHNIPAALERLTILRSEGYRFPDDVLTDLQDQLLVETQARTAPLNRRKRK